MQTHIILQDIHDTMTTKIIESTLLIQYFIPFLHVALV